MDKKKLSAAMAAVFAYIKTQEEAAAVCIPEVTEASVKPAPEGTGKIVQVQNNIWGISGRQTHMQSNAMIQLRMFK